MHSVLRDLAWTFGRLGFTAFGGPAAHIAMMHSELVQRRQWLSEEEFLDLIGITSLIPGPNSTELVFHIGLKRAGWRGLLVAGSCFIGPAMLIVLTLAWAYVRYGSLPETQALLDGLTPVILAIIVNALWLLGRKAVQTWKLALIALGSAVALWLGVHELLTLAVATLLGYLIQRPSSVSGPMALLLGMPLLAKQVAEWSLVQLGAVFFKIGAVLYGSGYVLIAFLRTDFVERLGWLTDQQLLDAVAVGQVTPGPLFTTATFIGYVVGAPNGVGVLAAVIATVAIFAPGAIFVLLTQPMLQRMQQSAQARLLLNSVNAASLGLMAAVTLQLTWTTFEQSALPAWAIVLLSCGSLLVLVRYRINATWLLAVGAIVGLLLSAL